jgi:hypothetical protein
MFAFLSSLLLFPFPLPPSSSLPSPLHSFVILCVSIPMTDVFRFVFIDSSATYPRRATSAGGGREARRRGGRCVLSCFGSRKEGGARSGGGVACPPTSAHVPYRMLVVFDAGGAGGGCGRGRRLFLIWHVAWRGGACGANCRVWGRPRGVGYGRSRGASGMGCGVVLGAIWRVRRLSLFLFLMERAAANS